MLKFRIIILFSLVIMPFSVGNSIASVSISISPIAGGTTLRFSRSDVISDLSKELRIRVTSSDATQYQIFQRWVQPLNSPASPGLQQNILKFYGLSGSNGFGTIYGQLPEIISMSDQLIYTSSMNGVSDTFVLVYQVDRQRVASSGQFIGRLLLTLRPIGSGAIQEVYLDVFVDVELGFDFSIKGVRGGNLIRLNEDSFNQRKDKVVAAFKGNVGEIRVYQEVLTSIALVTDNKKLAKGLVTYQTKGASDSVQVPMAKTLDFGRKLIYRSWKIEDSWDIIYEFNADKTFPSAAGLYTGRIRYTLESGQDQKVYDFDIEIEIDPVFELKLEFPEGKVSFSNLYPGAAPQDRLVVVKVTSNLQKPYAISQNIRGPLQNERKESIDSENFLMKTVVGARSFGKGKIPNLIPVPNSNNEYLFVSDSLGSSVEFEVHYRVVPYADMFPGDYRTEIMYTLGEI